MNTMDNFIAVNEKAEGIIGKIFYFSTARILIPKTKFIEIGNAFGLPKFKPAKESKAGAYRNATTAIRDRVVVKDTSGTHVYCVYCRNNRHEDDNYIYRELVKETQGSRTNEYLKLANIIFDKQTETVRVENCVYDADVDVDAYCRQAEELFLQFCDYYSTKQVETVIMDQLERMQSNKISRRGLTAAARRSEQRLPHTANAIAGAVCEECTGTDENSCISFKTKTSGLTIVSPLVLV